MKKFTPILTALSFGLALAFSPLSQAKDHEGHKQGPLKHMLAQLDLTQAQRQDIREVLKQGFEDASIDGDDRHAMFAQLMPLIHSQNWDEQAVLTVLSENQQNMAELGLKKATAMHQIWLVLSPEQQAKFTELADARPGPKGKHKDDKKQGERARGFDHKPADGLIFKGLDLTDEQQAKVKSILSETKTDAKATRGEDESFRQAERKLIASHDFSANAYQALQARYQAQRLQQGVLMAKSRHDIWNTLTPEQQTKAMAKMTEMREHKQAKMAKHKQDS
jgi:periplasmic protein CpxP/Spy